MKISSFLLATAFSAPTTYDTENFITSSEIDWVLSMDWARVPKTVYSESFTVKLKKRADNENLAMALV